MLAEPFICDAMGQKVRAKQKFVAKLLRIMKDFTESTVTLYSIFAGF